MEEQARKSMMTKLSEYVLWLGLSVRIRTELNRSERMQKAYSGSAISEFTII